MLGAMFVDVFVQRAVGYAVALLVCSAWFSRFQLPERFGAAGADAFSFRPPLARSATAEDALRPARRRASRTVAGFSMTTQLFAAASSVVLPRMARPVGQCAELHSSTNGVLAPGPGTG